MQRVEMMGFAMLAQIFERIGFEFRLTSGAAEQDFLAFVEKAMRRLGLHLHAANRIGERFRDGGIVMIVAMSI